MKPELETMKCDWCGRVFPADARACVEQGIEVVQEPEPGEEWKGEQPVIMPPGELSQQLRDQMKQVMGLDDSQLDELLATGKVDGLGAIICLQCQNNGAEASG